MAIKNNKKSFFVIVLATVVLLTGVAIGSIRNSLIVTTYTRLSYYADSIDKLSDDTQLIIVGIATNNRKKITYGGVDFITTEVKVNEVLKTGTSIDKTITLLQTKIQEDPAIEKGKEVLLFLEKYEGPIIDNAYVCKGLYQGQYKIKNKKVVINGLVKTWNPKLVEDIESKEELISFLKNKFNK